MLKNKTILIPFDLPWNWSADYQRQTCKILSKHNRVIGYFPHKASFFLKDLMKNKAFSNSTAKQSQFIESHIPTYYLPLRRFQFIEKLNQKLSLKLLKLSLPREVILWIFDPIFYWYPKFLKKSRWITIYDCVDYHSSREKKINQQIKKQEKILLENVDIVLTNSQTLQQIHRQYLPRLVPQGFDNTIFSSPSATTTTTNHLPSNKPIVGYTGGINMRLDFKLLLTLAKQSPQWNFVLIGPKQFSESQEEIQLEKQLNLMREQTNIMFYPEIDKQEIPHFLNQFDICMIPYETKNKFNLYSYPMKLFEYFYSGKPVISTPIQELQLPKFKQLVSLESTANEWQKQISEILAQPWPKKYQQRQKKLALQNTWQKKVELSSQIINNYLAKKLQTYS